MAAGGVQHFASKTDGSGYDSWKARLVDAGVAITKEVRRERARSVYSDNPRSE